MERWTNCLTRQQPKLIIFCALHISRVRSYGACYIRLLVSLVPNVECVVYAFLLLYRTLIRFVQCDISWYPYQELTQNRIWTSLGSIAVRICSHTLRTSLPLDKPFTSTNLPCNYRCGIPRLIPVELFQTFIKTEKPSMLLHSKFLLLVPTIALVFQPRWACIPLLLNHLSLTASQVLSVDRLFPITSHNKEESQHNYANFIGIVLKL